MKWYEMQAVEAKGSAPASATIRIHSQIGRSMFDDSGIEASKFIEDLDAMGDIGQINLHINSPGGSVYDGLAIYNSLRRHPANIDAYVDGIAASIASVIMLAADKRHMPRNTEVMVHSPTRSVMGSFEAGEFLRMAESLKTVEASILSVYVERTGMTEEDARALMEASTYMTAVEAELRGFATDLEDDAQLAASIDVGAFMSSQHVQLVTSVLAEKDAALNALQAKLDSLQEAPAEAEALLAACKEAGHEWVVPVAIENKWGITKTNTVLTEVTAVSDKLTAAGIDAAQIVQHINSVPDLVSQSIMAFADANDIEISGRNIDGGPAGGANSGPTFNVHEIYKNRNRAHKAG